jgi:hypothetical protein
MKWGRGCCFKGLGEKRQHPSWNSPWQRQALTKEWYINLFSVAAVAKHPRQGALFLKWVWGGFLGFWRCNNYVLEPHWLWWGLHDRWHHNGGTGIKRSSGARLTLDTDGLLCLGLILKDLAVFYQGLPLTSATAFHIIILLEQETLGVTSNPYPNHSKDEVTLPPSSKFSSSVSLPILLSLSHFWSLHAPWLCMRALRPRPASDPIAKPVEWSRKHFPYAYDCWWEELLTHCPKMTAVIDSRVPCRRILPYCSHWPWDSDSPEPAVGLHCPSWQNQYSCPPPRPASLYP